MRFQRRQRDEEPEINLVPMIDVLLVILIFLVVSTTYSKFSELEITLPQVAAEANQETDASKIIDVTINAAGAYSVNRTPVKFTSMEGLRDILQETAGDRKDPVIIISADARATHQSVITVMEAARLAGYNRVTFTTETTNANGNP